MNPRKEIILSHVRSYACYRSYVQRACFQYRKPFHSESFHAHRSDCAGSGMVYDSFHAAFGNRFRTVYDAVYRPASFLGSEKHVPIKLEQKHKTMPFACGRTGFAFGCHNRFFSSYDLAGHSSRHATMPPQSCHSNLRLPQPQVIRFLPANSLSR